MKYFNILLLAAFFAFSSCENDKTVETDSGTTDTTIVIHQNEEPETPAREEKKEIEQKEEPKPEPKEETINWRPLMDEYHELLCRRHKGNPQPNDAIRQVELTKELNDARSKLPKDQQFEFTTAMARAANMAACK